MESGERTPINLQKLLTPASDTQEPLHSKNKKMFASSYFYAPTHPTVEDQVELARRISLSLSDVKNMKSKGQSMYVNRKKRSVKWIHDGNGTEGEEEPSSPMHKDKVPLKCVMNPHGKVLDIHGIQALGEEVNIEPMPSHPEKLFDIVRDLNNQRGRGAEIFAKRRKRSEKWVVDQDQSQTPSTHGGPKTPVYPYQSEMNGNSKYSSMQSSFGQTEKPFYNPFTVDLSLNSVNPPTTGRYHHHHRHHHRSCQLTNDCNHSTQVQKIYLREVAVGTDTDFPTIEKPELNNDARYQHSNGFSSFNGTGRSSQANVERRSNKSLGSKTNSNNAQIATNKETKTNKSREVKQRLAVNNNFYQGNVVNDKNKFRKKQQPGKREEEEEEETRISDTDGSEYTPVPVKQLIQEFEKTCRPVLQYKQISPKIIPIAQQCPIDENIARFFQTRTSVKYQEQVVEDDDEEDEEDDDEDEDDDDDDDEEEYIRRPNRENRPEKQFVKSVPEKQVIKPVSMMHQQNGYLSTDETEYTSEDSMQAYEFKDYKDYKEESSMYRYEKKTSHISNGNVDYPSVTNDEYSTNRRRSATSQELESYCNGDVKFVNEDSVLPAQAKSYLLSMVASQDDILATIKHLRNTPVLDNLLPGVSPEIKFTDTFPEVGTKLYENEDNSYKGPKLASVHNLTNYNTAPRGWDQSLIYYRPIKFEKSQDTIVYSDF